MKWNRLEIRLWCSDVLFSFFFRAKWIQKLGEEEMKLLTTASLESYDEKSHTTEIMRIQQKSACKRIEQVTFHVAFRCDYCGSWHKASVSTPRKMHLNMKAVWLQLKHLSPNESLNLSHSRHNLYGNLNPELRKDSMLFSGPRAAPPLYPTLLHALHILLRSHPRSLVHMVILQSTLCFPWCHYWPPVLSYKHKPCVTCPTS